MAGLAPAAFERDAARARPLVAPWRVRAASAVTPYLFLTPKFLFFLVFMLYPLGRAIVLSFQSGAILEGLQFAGPRNYGRLLDDEVFWIGLRNSFLYTILVIPLVIGVGIVLAGLLNRPIRFRPLFLALLIVPTVASTVAASVIWTYLLQTDGGLFNTLLGLVGLGPVNWLGTPSLVIPIFVALECWRGAGFYTILFLAAMQSIPRHLYDAAAIDGAAGLQAFRLITLPLMRPTILFASVMATIWNLQLFDSPYVMTKGGPGYASTTIVMYIYQQAFKFDRLGLAATMAIVLLLIMLALAAIQLRVFRREIEF